MAEARNYEEPTNPAQNMGNRSDAASPVGSSRAANSALANSDMQEANGLASSDNNSYAEL